MRVVKLLLSVLLLSSCSSGNQNFISKFKKIEILDSLGFFSEETILNEDLDILEKTNEVNGFVFNSKVKNYYGSSFKLNKDHFILSYKKTYSPMYNPSFSMFKGKDVFLCIYNIRKNEVVSKLKISSSDPIFSNFKYSSEVFSIKSYYRNYKYDEIKNRGSFEIDTIENKFIIKNNKFCITNPSSSCSKCSN